MPAEPERATKADEKRYYDRRRRQDVDRSDAYNHGQAGTKPRSHFEGKDAADGTDLADYWDIGAGDKDPSGAGPKPPRTPRPGLPSASRSGGRSSSSSLAGVGSSGAGFLAGAVVWALVSAYFDYGPAGPRAWLASKFLNRSTAPASKAPPGKAPLAPVAGVSNDAGRAVAHGYRP